MRLIRIVPLAIALAVAVVVPMSSASAEYSYSFGAPRELSGKSRLGALQREETRERPARRERASSRRAQRGEERARRADRRGRSQAARRMIRDSDDDQAYAAPRSRSQARRRGTRVASLGSGLDGGWSSGGSHGIASFYWQPQRVASGGWFNPNAMTAAHKTLPFGTRVRVTHAANGRSVIVRINDRGPYIRGRIIDLSRAAAGVIGMTGQGVARIRMEVLGR
jgi:rare lipoprotein A